MRAGRSIWTVITLAAILCGGLVVRRCSALDGAPTRKKPVNLTADGTLLLNGKPFFPIGIYQVNHTGQEYAMLAANGFNAIQGNFATDVPQFMETLRLAERHKLAVAVPLHAENLVKENLAKSLDKIRAAAGHPVVLSWKICDEPDSEIYARLRSEVPPAYRAIKALQPGQPVELTLCQDATLGRWTKYSDLVEIDRYPVPGRPLTQVLDFCRRARKEMEPWQNLTYVVQCGWTRDLKTQPTYGQARSMVYLALIGGAKGIFWYSRKEDEGWDLTTTPLWPRMKEINAEIASLADPVMFGLDVPGIRCSKPDVRFACKRHLDKLYLLVTNPVDAPAKAVFTLPAGSHARAARLSGTGRLVSLNGESVSIPLGGTDSATVILEL